jgi:hypothetical protein
MTDPQGSGPRDDLLRWESALDALEQAALHGAQHAPPSDLPALPTQLEHRAREVMAVVRLRRIDFLAERDAVGAELARLARAGRTGTGRRAAAPAAATAGHHDTRM